jgi:thiol-disulfide isomerase/thioredoxin
MDKKIIIALSLLLMVFTYGCTGGTSHSQGIQGQVVAGNTGKVGITLGNLAPDFTVNTIDGKTVSLSRLTSEKPTVLYFFATWCPNCAKDFATLKKVYPQYADKVNFLAVDMDLKESEYQIAGYKQKLSIPGIEFAAGKKDILADYNVIYTTTKYFVGKDGTILNKGVGGIDENTWHKVFQSMAQ